MIQHVWERASQSSCLSELLIATDDARIAAAARGFGAQVAMTRNDHESGTDRVAEAAAATGADVVVNIQGDEPLIDPAAIQTAVLSLLDDDDCQMATLKKQISRQEEIANPNVVKVVTSLDGKALYFSRSLLPHAQGQAIHFKHIGLYVYRRPLLLSYSSLRRGPLEAAERLEQLRALENGISIRVAETGYETLGVDAPGDLAAVEAALAASLTPASPLLHHG